MGKKERQQDKAWKKTNSWAVGKFVELVGGKSPADKPNIFRSNALVVLKEIVKTEVVLELQTEKDTRGRVKGRKDRVMSEGRGIELKPEDELALMVLAGVANGLIFPNGLDVENLEEWMEKRGDEVSQRFLEHREEVVDTLAPRLEVVKKKRIRNMIKAPNRFLRALNRAK